MEQPKTLPKSLYRFFDENGLKMLIDGTLKLTPPREFNDPFEFSLGIPENLNSTDDEIRAHFLTPNSVARNRYSSRHASEIEYAKWVETTAVGKKQLIPQYQHYLVTDFRNWISSAFGVICFCGIDDTEALAELKLPMWSHYAINHKGMAIGFDTSLSNDQNWLGSIAFVKVCYLGERPVIKLSDFNDTSQDGLQKLVCKLGEIKSESWGHEKEWRLIFILQPAHPERLNTPEGREFQKRFQSTVVGERILYFLKLWNNDDEPEAKKTKAKFIRRVVLGARASSDLIASVRTALNQSHLRHVDLFQAQLSPHTFQLNAELIRKGVA